MKKQFSIIRVSLVLLAFGLSGCTDSAEVIVPITDIHENPDRYINREVSVKGLRMDVGDAWDELGDISVSFFEYVDTSNLTDDAEYD